MDASKSLRHRTMASVAAEEIRDRILGGTYPPGAPLRQDGLATELGMSRIPIREALVQLESEGFVRILPHRGAVVVELSGEEVEELFNMRLLLEPFLFERSAPKLTDEDFQALIEIQDRYVASIDNLDIGQWNLLNTEFHMLLYRHAQSARVTGLVQGILAECDRHTRIQLSQIREDRERAVREHAALLRLCREGRFAEGAALLHDHIDHIRRVLVALLAKKQEQGSPA